MKQRHPTFKNLSPSSATALLQTKTLPGHSAQLIAGQLCTAGGHTASATQLHKAAATPTNHLTDLQAQHRLKLRMTISFNPSAFSLPLNPPLSPPLHLLPPPPGVGAAPPRAAVGACGAAPATRAAHGGAGAVGAAAAVAATAAGALGGVGAAGGRGCGEVGRYMGWYMGWYMG